MRAAVILLVFVSSSVLAQFESVYRIGPECILEASIENNPIVVPPAKLGFQINVQLSKSEGEQFKQFTKGIIGSNLKVTNGFGESLNMPSNRVVTEIGQKFRLAPYATKEEANKAMLVLMKKGGRCGKAS
ncbi:MAG: hypothetical protein KBT72_12890 [Zhongshania sp.]|nr:hypothetical protein [Zhongshania sp.]